MIRAKLRLAALQSALALLVGLSACLDAKDYYIDSQKAFDAINDITLEPGDVPEIVKTCCG